MIPEVPLEIFEVLFQLPLQIPFVVIGVVFLQFYYVIIDSFGIRLIATYGGLIFAHLFSLAQIREVFARQVQQGKGPMPVQQQGQPQPAQA